jgi:hypothetical protein
MRIRTALGKVVAADVTISFHLVVLLGMRSWWDEREEEEEEEGRKDRRKYTNAFVSG